MTMERWEPFSEMLSLRDAMNRLLEESFVRPSLATRSMPGGMSLPVDLRETEDQYVLEAALPGVKPEDIEVSVQGNHISIRGEVKQEQERKGERYHVRERRVGQFQRSIALPNTIQADRVSCDFKNGVLTVTLPKAEEARPRRIQISSGEQRRAIEGRTGDVGQQTPQQTQQ